MVLAGCNEMTYEAVYPTLSDGKYDSEFPYRNCSEQLDEIASSLVKLDVLVFYNTYTFSLDDGISIDDIRSTQKNIDKLGGFHDIYSESVGGTAISIYQSGYRIAFLTCAHILDYPDTVVSYFPSPDGHLIHAIGIKARQQNNISVLPHANKLEVLAINSRDDIAIIGKETDIMNDDPVRVLNYPMGDSEELEWGSFVYIMGYPMGHAMITRGIVSNPERIRKGSFLIDAVFNQGFSGGAVIAVRDGVPNFEMVGMVRSSAATQRYYLAPENPESVAEMNLLEPYRGDMKVVSEKDIKYGITFSVTSKLLREFYRDNRKQLRDKGYDLDDFFLKSE